MTITADKMEAAQLKPIIYMADAGLRNKNAAFAAMMEKLQGTATPIEITNIQYAGSLMHTPQTMQSTLAGWLQKQYGVTYLPVVGQNFFPHGMRDPRGRENYFLFYFDL